MRASCQRRYLAGDHVAVWRELIELGSRIYEPDVFEDALAVCREVVSRAATNLRLLHGRLIDLGYQFASPQEALVEAGPVADTVIWEFETEFGEMPLIARVWYQRLASVDFMQARAQLRNDVPGAPSPAAPDVAGLGSHNVLRVWSLAAARADWHRQRAEAEADLAEGKAAGGWPPHYQLDFPPFLCLGRAASNCEAVGFRLPCRGVDGVVRDDGLGPMSFVAELRWVFRAGGFPYWGMRSRGPAESLSWEHRPNVEKLLPVLREGLLEL